MKEVECIPYRNTGYFSSLILDYLDRKPELKEFIADFPDIKAFKSRMESRGHFSSTKRKRLQTSLLNQYQEAQVQLHPRVAASIELLSQDNCYTVTTGHQLSILSGPLYFIYKILDAIKLAEQLKEEYPEAEFVPIYWMATEDHDFEEIAFINLFGGKLKWHNDLKGAVGHMPTFGMGKVLDELEEHLGPGKQAKEILAIFREAYHERQNLSQATRYFVNALFEQFGLVILDGDDKVLKREMIPTFRKDLKDGTIHQKLQAQSQALSETYFSQVFPREINLFYLSPGKRERIEKKEDRWVVLNTNISFTEEELEQELESHPERFSPNVALRPVYQEQILPNLAYIGGGGEIAYWFQLKSMFDELELPFPLLILRNSVLLVPEKWQNRLNDLGLELSHLFHDLDKIKADYLKAGFPKDAELTKFDCQLEEMFSELEELALLTDESMLGAVNAQRQKQLNGIENLRKKLIRAEKRRNKERMEKLERIYFALFPKGGLQERHDNLSPYYADYGPALIEKLHKNLNPLDFRFTLIRL